MRHKFLVAALLAASIGQAAYADTARERLDSFFTNVKSLKGSFTQQVFDKKGAVTQNSSGDLYLSRPGRFRWVYKTPEPQEMIGDGKNVWIYDKDLEQVTVKPVNQAVSNTPIAILTRLDPPGSQFNVQEIQGGSGLDWHQLVPKQASRDFKYIQLGLDTAGNLKRMVLFDQLGQRTEISLNAQNNVPISGSTFYFSPPRGVDVIGKPQ
jgi:outer membrane lipoprotein carrier protein